MIEQKYPHTNKDRRHPMNAGLMFALQLLLTPIISGAVVSYLTAKSTYEANKREREYKRRT